MLKKTREVLYVFLHGAYIHQHHTFSIYIVMSLIVMILFLPDDDAIGSGFMAKNYLEKKRVQLAMFLRVLPFHLEIVVVN